MVGVPLIVPSLIIKLLEVSRPDDVLTGDGDVELLVLIAEEDPDVAAVLEMIDELELAAVKGSAVPHSLSIVLSQLAKHVALPSFAVTTPVSGTQFMVYEQVFSSVDCGPTDC
ncbi:hypothetical protein AB5N19_04632 [Seiridium cardinale]|uniref:Uncharacterized protein n=1 Tax=Seiridium cardinale TaxID=138064 RepID=A0ABR2X8Q1_9PEZI